MLPASIHFTQVNGTPNKSAIPSEMSGGVAVLIVPDNDLALQADKSSQLFYSDCFGGITGFLVFFQSDFALKLRVLKEI